MEGVVGNRILLDCEEVGGKDETVGERRDRVIRREEMMSRREVENEE